MELRLVIDTKQQKIPFNYHQIIQGIIYHALTPETGKQLHDEGYGEKRKFKLFVFSELKGNYNADHNGLVFLQQVQLHIASLSTQFINELYLYFKDHRTLSLNGIEVEILNMKIKDDIEYHENEEYVLKTLSPITCYKTEDNGFTNYIHPNSEEFEQALIGNLERKQALLGEQEGSFKLLEVVKYKKRIVKYKKVSYCAYDCTLKVKVSNQLLHVLLNTGLGTKNPAGFGMVKIIG